MTSDNLSAVVLAGGVKRFSLREFYHQLEDIWSYHEWYFRRGFKALKRIKLKGMQKPRPMVEYIMGTLDRIESIDDIVVVGPEKEMREKLDPNLLESSGKIRLMQQRGSYGDNVMAGYEASSRDYVLFLTADSPTTKEEAISEFISICRKLENRYDTVYPIVKESLLMKYFKHFPRPCFRMKPDSIIPHDYLISTDFRDDGRVGFRITSMTYANLQHASAELVNEAYNVRKFYRRSSRKTLRKLLGDDIIKRYRNGFLMSELEQMYLDFTGLSLKFVGLNSAGASLDIDSTRDKKSINNLSIY